VFKPLGVSEHCAANDETIGASRSGCGNGRRSDAAIDFDVDVEASVDDDLAKPTDFGFNRSYV
jgi:hypothetical protein